MTAKPSADGDPNAFTFSLRSEDFDHTYVLAVDGRSGRALQLADHDGADLPNPIGLSGTILSPGQRDALSTALQAVAWGQLPEPRGGDFHRAVLTIDYKRGDRLMRRSFSAGAGGPFARAIAPVMQQVDALVAAVDGHPLRQLALTLERTARGFKLVLANPGTGRVVLNDPRALNRSKDATCGRVAIAHRAPNDNRPMDTDSFKPLLFLDAGKQHLPLIIEPRKRFEVETIPWTPSALGRYAVQARWIDHDGPLLDSKMVLAELPPPDQVDDRRPYVIRGAAFARSIQLNVDSPGRL